MFIVEEVYSFSSTFGTIEEAEVVAEKRIARGGDRNIVIAEVKKAYRTEDVPYKAVNVEELQAKLIEGETD